MSLFFLKRSATTNSTSVINQKASQASQSSHHHHHQSSSVSVQNLLSLTKRYSFLTQTDLTNSDLLLTTPSTNTSSSSNNNYNNKSLNDLNDLNDAKREREKFNVLKEVISSEKKYLNDLKEIVDGYYDEISKFKHDNKEFVYHIFSNIKDIYEFTK
jgi:hypothetical protein